MSDPQRPLPQPTDITAPYWSAAKEGKLLYQFCMACQHWQFFPRAFCVHCGAEDLQWREASGRGKIYTFTINRRATNAFMKTKLPYAVAIVETEEGIKTMANIIHTDLDAIRIGMPVKVAFEQVSDGLALPQFEAA